MKTEASRGLIKSMLIVGSAQSITIAVGILRLKLVAMILGPAGIGLLGLYTNLVTVASTLGGLGLGSSGVRQIAVAREDDAELSRVRRVLIGANLVQGAAAALAIWLFRHELAVLIFDDSALAFEVGVSGIAVLLSLIAASQTALLQGLRRIKEVAQVSLVGGLVGSVVGVASVWLLGTAGLIWLIVAIPAASALTAYVFTRRLPRPAEIQMDRQAALARWREMAQLGIVFMAGGLLSAATLLWARSFVLQEIGVDATGYFQAAWTISMQYVGFLLGAMAADYYPRLAGMIKERDASNSLVNDQLQLALAVGGPIILAMIGLAPWVLELLYTSEFHEAATILQWQMLGNILKLGSWSVGFIIVAKARSGLFFTTQALWNVVFVVQLYFGLGLFGLEVTGIAFVLAYVVHFAVEVVLARRVHGFAFERLSLVLLACFFLGAAMVLGFARTDPVAGMVAGLASALVTGMIGLRVVLHKTGAAGGIAARVATIFALIGWPLEKPGAR